MTNPFREAVTTAITASSRKYSLSAADGVSAHNDRSTTGSTTRSFNQLKYLPQSEAKERQKDDGWSRSFRNNVSMQRVAGI